MAAQIIDGKAIAARVRAEVAEETARLKADKGITPGLTVVRVGDDPASKLYVGSKNKAAKEVGFNGVEFHMPADSTHEAVLAKVRALNADDEVDGILVQLPLPKQVDPDAIIAAIDPLKDVDGFHPVNVGNLTLGRPALKPCTPWGCMRLIAETGTNLAGKKAVVVGRSNIVGKPMAMMLLHANATVTICHSKSDVRREVEQADIVVAAVGVRELVRGEWIKPGAVVIDVGQNVGPDKKLRGDVEFDAAKERASWITPVPGGVGPMTVATLMRNTLDAAKARRGSR